MLWRAALALSYLGNVPYDPKDPEKPYLDKDSYGVREDAFFCYASARLSGFIWNGGTETSNPEYSDLYRIRLGKPITPEAVENGVYYRVFEQGLVAVNPETDQARTIDIVPHIPTKYLQDLFGVPGVDNWAAYPGNGYRTDFLEKHSGTRSIICVNKIQSDTSGAYQAITLNQSVPRPITVCGWSKADSVSGASDGNYSLYIDFHDGNGNLIGHADAPFGVGTHDWELQTITIQPIQPIKSLTLYVLFRYRTGTVWFDDITVRAEPSDQAPCPPELLLNGGFEQESYPPALLDLSTPGSTLLVPKFSGRVYLFTFSPKSEVI